MYLGIIAAGGIFTGANPGYTVFEVAHHLRVCNAKFVVADLQTLSKVKEAAAEVGIPESNIIVFDVHHEGVPSGAKSFWDLIGDDEITVEDVADSANVPASYISSSGTSGLPKAVVIPHAYLINQCQIQTERKMPYEVSNLLIYQRLG
jgi:acyl-coenzyme A synthetase/AMP-(fatty) acid ligase